MEIVARTPDLARVLRLLQPLADRKGTIPALGTVLVRAEAKGVSMTATDGNLGGIAYCPATVRAPGSVAIPAQRLSDYVGMLPEGELVLKEQMNGWVSLTCSRPRSRLATVSAASFPELPKPPREGASFPGGVLGGLIEKALIAISTQSAKANLARALLKIDASMLTMVATDGHRLALVTAPVEILTGEKSPAVLIPRKTLTAFLRFAEGREDQPVRCAVTENHLFYVWQDRLLFSRQLSGTFPPYERVLPQSHAASLSLNRHDLRSALERVGQFTEDRTRCVVVEVSTNQLSLRAREATVGESEESLAVPYAGEPTRIGFHVAHLMDFLNRAEQPNVRFLFNNAETATEWQPATEAMPPDFRYVVMPMRID